MRDWYDLRSADGDLYHQLLAATARAAADGFTGPTALVAYRWKGYQSLVLEVRR